MDSPSKPTFTYHVFLSFSYKDTHKNFVDHLHTALMNAGIHAFRDNDKLEKGENLELQLQKVIEGSRIFLIVFSEGYFASRRCLDEIVKIVENCCSGNHEAMLLPVFYGVDRDRLRDKTWSEEFRNHERRFGSQRVNNWRAVLKQVADLQGSMSLQDQPERFDNQTRFEAKFVQDIVKEIERRLKRRTILRVAVHSVGINSRIERINSWLQDGSMDVSILAICGIGGIGKTTIAKAAYNINFDKFEGSSFLSNVRDAFKQPCGLVRLQRQLLYDILKKKVRKFYNVDEGIIKIKDAISSKRVLLVLDDVDDPEQLHTILGMRGWFHQGSKIIITTRQMHLSWSHEQCEMYEVKKMNYVESLKLFSWYSFGLEYPDEVYKDISTNVVYHCGGIPLALQILGSSLSGRSMDIWRSTLEKLKTIPDNQILRKLSISYEHLPDDHDKNLFLDIACFFLGKDKDYSVTVLDHNFYPVVGIQNLIDRNLLQINHKNKLVMHHLIRDMGRQITCQESPHPEKRSRIWQHKDSFNIIKHKTGTEKIKGLVLDMQEFKESRKRCHFDGKLVPMDQERSTKRRRREFFGTYDIGNHSEIINDLEFETDAFQKLHNLRLLQLGCLQLTGCYAKLPESLIWIDWRGFNLKYIPEEFPLEGLVALDLRNSSLEQVWKGTKFLGQLKILNLSHSHDLRSTPIFSGLPNLKTLILKDCIRLTELHKSIEELERLSFLNLRDCRNLQRFPRNLSKLKSLKKLVISGCRKLVILPIELAMLESLETLHADDVALNPSTSVAKRKSKSWNAFLKPWTSSNIETSLEFNKFSLSSLTNSLTSLSLANCNLSDYSISIDLSSMTHLQYLNLSGNLFTNLPSSIKNLYMLRNLWLDICTKLQSVPELPSSLTTLKAADCTSLERITNLPNRLGSLFLYITGCRKLVEVEKKFILEFLGNFDAEMLKSLGILNIESIGNVEVELFNSMADVRVKFPVQGLYEFGIFSTNIPATKIPDWLSSSTGTGNQVWFTVRSHIDIAIKRLNIGMIYRRCRSARKFELFANEESGHWFTYYIKICNETKNLKWVYKPMFIGIPGENEDLAFLSHWKMQKTPIEAGDKVIVSVIGLSATFVLKGFGIDFVYDDDDQRYENRKSSDDDVVDDERESIVKVRKGKSIGTLDEVMIDEDLSEYQLRPGSYFLSHAHCFKQKSDSETANVLLEQLFGDNTVMPADSAEREEDDEESQSDYSEVDEKEVEDEIEELLAEPDWWR